MSFQHMPRLGTEPSVQYDQRLTVKNASTQPGGQFLKYVGLKHASATNMVPWNT